MAPPANTVSQSARMDRLFAQLHDTPPPPTRTVQANASANPTSPPDAKPAEPDVPEEEETALQKAERRVKELEEKLKQSAGEEQSGEDPPPDPAEGASPPPPLEQVPAEELPPPPPAEDSLFTQDTAADLFLEPTAPPLEGGGAQEGGAVTELDRLRQENERLKKLANQPVQELVGKMVPLLKGMMQDQRLRQHTFPLQYSLKQLQSPNVTQDQFRNGQAVFANASDFARLVRTRDTAAQEMQRKFARTAAQQEQEYQRKRLRSQLEDARQQEIAELRRQLAAEREKKPMFTEPSTSPSVPRPPGAHSVRARASAYRESMKEVGAAGQAVFDAYFQDALEKNVEPDQAVEEAVVAAVNMQRIFDKYGVPDHGGRMKETVGPMPGEPGYPEED